MSKYRTNYNPLSELKRRYDANNKSLNANMLYIFLFGLPLGNIGILDYILVVPVLLKSLMDKTLCFRDEVDEGLHKAINYLRKTLFGLLAVLNLPFVLIKAVLGILFVAFVVMPIMIRDFVLKRKWIRSVEPVRSKKWNGKPAIKPVRCSSLKADERSALENLPADVLLKIDSFTNEQTQEKTAWPKLAQCSLRLFAMTRRRRLERLLKHVYRGELHHINIILDNDPSLLTAKVKFTDLSNRSFQMTAYQYALWSLDKPMQRLIKGYLDKNEAQWQFDELQTRRANPIDREDAGAHFSLQPLLSSLRAFKKRIDDSYGNQDENEMWQFWRENVGKEYRKLPAWFAHHIKHNWWHSRVVSGSVKRDPKHLQYWFEGKLGEDWAPLLGIEISDRDSFGGGTSLYISTSLEVDIECFEKILAKLQPRSAPNAIPALD